VSAPPVPQKPRPFGYEHFRHLGYEMNDSGSPDFMLYGVKSRKIHRFSPSKFTTANLCTIAPFEWWEQKCPKSKGGIELDTAAVAIINGSYAAGIYNPDMVRGRGAWVDQNRYVLHVGDHLIVDGVAVNFGDFESDYIYEVAPSLDFHTGKPATTEQGAEFIRFLSDAELGARGERLAARWLVHDCACLRCAQLASSHVDHGQQRHG
jgi:hypothetical protein